MREGEAELNIWERAKNYFRGEEILRDWVGSGGHPVDKELAQARASVCLNCPKNKPGIAVVESLAAAIKALVEFKNAMHLRVLGEHSLLSCEACDCPLKTKIWVPLKRITPTEEEKPKFHEDCWLLHEKPE